MTSHESDAKKLESVLRLAFGNDRQAYDRFCQIVRQGVPEAHAAVLRGSAITGQRHTDAAPFDADGPGTSDLDLTLIGSEVLRYYSAFWIPGIHSKPLSDDDPDIAPELTPLRQQLMEMVRRPVNIQGTRDWLQHFRGDIMDQPYLILFGKHQGTVTLRLLSYNIMKGGSGREASIASVINACSPDVVVLQEAGWPSVVKDLARRCGMSHWVSTPGHSVACMSRGEIASHVWRRVRWAKRAYLELVTSHGLTIYGVHLSAVHSNITEQRRAYEVRALLNSVAQQAQRLHLITGDFNTLAPGERLDMSRLPPRIRAFAWITGKNIRWITIRLMLEAEYTDGYRALHPDDEGPTFPSWDPHVRLDYTFIPAPFAVRLVNCDVPRHLPFLREASDHLPLLSEVSV